MGVSDKKLGENRSLEIARVAATAIAAGTPTVFSSACSNATVNTWPTTLRSLTISPVATSNRVGTNATSGRCSTEKPRSDSTSTTRPAAAGEANRSCEALTNWRGEREAAVSCLVGVKRAAAAAAQRASARPDSAARRSAGIASASMSATTSDRAWTGDGAASVDARGQVVVKLSHRATTRTVAPRGAVQARHQLVPCLPQQLCRLRQPPDGCVRGVVSTKREARKRRRRVDRRLSIRRRPCLSPAGDTFHTHLRTLSATAPGTTGTAALSQSAPPCPPASRTRPPR